jgi:hypothetical protein
MADLQVTKTVLTEGDALEPSGTDILTQFGRLKVGEPLPDGWTVLTGNRHDSLVARVLYREDADPGWGDEGFELEDELVSGDPDADLDVAPDLEDGPEVAK